MTPEKQETLPRIRLKKLELINFGKHEDIAVDFTKDGEVMPLACFVGPNGTGKSTILNAIQNLCSDFSSYDDNRYFGLMSKSVHNIMNMSPKELLKLRTEPKMILRGTFQRDDTSDEYVVELNQIKPVSKHPEDIHPRVVNYCFYARFDMELHTFQLRRDRWKTFSELFSAITGYPIEEDTSVFNLSQDRDCNDILKEYVVGFRFMKEGKPVSHRQCSSGERKIAKCFSTILNKPIQPSIILIDNATMHVEVGRHLAVIDSMEKCFPDSQIIATCHSVPVTKSISRRERLMDMRFLLAPPWIRGEPWRLRMIDDMSEAVERLRNTGLEDKVAEGLDLIDRLNQDPGVDHAYDNLLPTSCEFLSKVPILLAQDFEATPFPKLGKSVDVK